MHLHGRPVPLPLVLTAFLALCLLATAAVAGPLGGSKADAESTAPESVTTAERGARTQAPPPPPPPPARLADGWSGYAFDACRAPSQAVMDRWRTASPFTGVGIYLGGIHRACEQRHLTSRWVTRQIRSGWQLLPIWVGPQASCTGYDHRIDGRPGRSGRYDAARTRGTREARRAAATARSLRVPKGEVIFYDIEPFDTRRERCRRSSLVFLEAWTNEIHREGYRSGVYSHVNSGISLLSRTGAGYVRPDAVWYAWIDQAGAMPREHVADHTFMHTSRVHQYALDTKVEFGGVKMAIDWNFVSLGARRPVTSTATCEQAADRVRPRNLRSGARGRLVQVVQCLVAPGERHPMKTTGRYDRATVKAVQRYQKRSGLPATGTVDRRTWTSLLARGHTPVLKKGARGEHVRRLQRTLNAAAGRPKVQVDGAFGPSTARAVRHYRKELRLGKKPVVTKGLWKALERGRVVPDKRPKR
ncbi:glycoside hydrolase domain-containing protein [Nocardioides sp. SYSU DS0651]|uniref:glycoside hydrolase domain-containing protein n=1 Tax=Nocardioides sp. SYSU DS0651 TaxID=3415955 RepID=UPI003F4BD1CB